MGKYRLGDIICMTRKSLSITQEQLSEGICSVETLSRVENGKQNPSRDVYELLMERMGRSRDRSYSVMTVSDFDIMEKINLLEDYINTYDYNRAEEVVEEIKDLLMDTNLNRQYLLRTETVIKYRLKKIDAKEFLERLEQAILITIPLYGSISLSNWPFTLDEAILILNISSAYAQNQDYQKAIEILVDANIVMKQEYMEEPRRINLQANYYNNISKWYGIVGDYEKAIEVAKEGIEICKKHRLGHVLPNLLYGIAWNLEQLIDKGVISPERKNECIQYIKQAYYIAAAMQQPFLEQFFIDHIKSVYDTALGEFM